MKINHKRSNYTNKNEGITINTTELLDFLPYAEIELAKHNEVVLTYGNRGRHVVYHRSRDGRTYYTARQNFAGLRAPTITRKNVRLEVTGISYVGDGYVD